MENRYSPKITSESLSDWKKQSQCKNDSILARHDYEDIEEIVSSCEKMHEIPEQTTQRTHANSRCPFITLADSWFKYFRAQKSKLSCGHRLLFKVHWGTPTQGWSKSKCYYQYAYRCGMKITTIIPTYSQSNGLAEKAVHIVKTC